MTWDCAVRAAVMDRLALARINIPLLAAEHLRRRAALDPIRGGLLVVNTEPVSPPAAMPTDPSRQGLWSYQRRHGERRQT